MLQKIKKTIYQTYSPNDCLGLFFSAFTPEGKLLISNGVVQTNKTIDNILDIFYAQYLQPYENQIAGIVFDVVTQLTPQTNLPQFLQLSPKEYGVVITSLQDGKSGALLPDTQGVITMQQAIACIQQKNQLTGNGAFATFKTQKITINK